MEPKKQVLPHSVETEEWLISCILIDGAPSLNHALNHGLKPESFYVPALRVIYQRLVLMLAADKPIELVTLTQELTIAKEMAQIGDMAYLVQISAHMPTTAHAEYFAKEVVRLHQLRQMIVHANQVVDACYDCGDNEIADLVAHPLSKLLSLTSGEESQREKNWEEVIDEALETVDSIIAHEGMPESRIIHWPWPVMDEYFGPMERQELIILAARASVGKSSMARACLRAVAQSGLHSYFVTLEVKPSRVVLSMASAMMRIGLKALGKAHPKDQQDFRAAIQGLRKLGINISYTDRRLHQIEAKAKALKSQQKLDFMVIDYGALIDDIVFADPRDTVNIIGQVQKRLKRLASELDIVILELWQINRGTEKENREPRISDLKGSGDLEADASRVIMLHRPDTDPDGMAQSEKSRVDDVPRYFTNVIQGKGRDQGTSMLSFWFRRAVTEYTPVTKEEPPAQQQDDLPI